MKTTKTFLVAAVALAAVTAYTSSAQAQTEAVTSTITVQNALALTVVENLNFGMVVAAGDTAAVSTLAIHPGTNALTPANNAPSLFSVIDNADAQAAIITVENGAPSAVLTVEIDNVTDLTYIDPVDGAVTFEITAFSTIWNGLGAPVVRAEAAPWTQIYDGLLPANQLNIGATLSTVAGEVYPVGDGTPHVYTGSFDVSFNY